MAEPTVRTETVLDQLVAGKREELADRLASGRPAAIIERAHASPTPLPFAAALRGQDVRLIAEIKRASPTAGLLEEHFEPVARARSYAEGGAAAISILTEERRFLGRLEDVTSVRNALASDKEHARLPLLRKDFLFDPYHLYEARAAGADAVLLIVAVLQQSALQDLLALADQLGLCAVVEVHDELEVDRALAAGSKVIGINNRDLRTFATSLEVSDRLAVLVPSGTLLISESGIRGRGDVQRLASRGIDAILVGETLMRSGDVAATARDLGGVARHARSQFASTVPGTVDGAALGSKARDPQ
jgi:indole-3-glycerol phosphate synthase